MDPTQRIAQSVYAETLIERHQSLIINVFAIWLCFCCFGLAIYFYSKRHRQRSEPETNDKDEDKNETEEQELTLINIARALSFHQETAKETLGATTKEQTIQIPKKKKIKKKKKRKKKRNKVRIRTFSMQSMDKYERYKNEKLCMNESDYSVIAQHETANGNCYKNEYGVDMLSFFKSGDTVQFNSDPDDDEIADRCMYGKVVGIDSNRGQITILRDDDGKKYTYAVGDIDVQPVQVMDTNETMLQCEKDEVSSSDASVCNGFEGEEKKKSYKRIKYQLDAMLDEIDETIM